MTHAVESTREIILNNINKLDNSVKDAQKPKKPSPCNKRISFDDSDFLAPVNPKSPKKPPNPNGKNQLNSTYEVLPSGGRIIFRQIPYALRNFINESIQRTVRPHLTGGQMAVMHYLFDKTHGWCKEGCVATTDQICNGDRNNSGTRLSPNTVRTALNKLQNLGIIYRGFRKGVWFIWINQSFLPTSRGVINEEQGIWSPDRLTDVYWLERIEKHGVVDYGSNKNAVDYLINIKYEQQKDFMKIAKLNIALKKIEDNVERLKKNRHLKNVERELREQKKLIENQQELIESQKGLINGGDMPLPKLKKGVSCVNAETLDGTDLDSAIEAKKQEINNKREEIGQEKRKQFDELGSKNKDLMDKYKNTSKKEAPKKKKKATITELEQYWVRGIEDRHNDHQEGLADKLAIPAWGSKEFGQMKHIINKSGLKPEQRADFVYFVTNKWNEIIEEYFKWVGSGTSRMPQVGFVLTMLSTFIVAFNYRAHHDRNTPIVGYILDDVTIPTNMDGKNMGGKVHDIFHNWYRNPEKIDINSPLFHKLPKTYQIQLRDSREKFVNYCEETGVEVPPFNTVEKERAVEETAKKTDPKILEIYSFLVKNPVYINSTVPEYNNLPEDYKNQLRKELYTYLADNPGEVGGRMDLAIKQFPKDIQQELKVMGRQYKASPEYQHKTAEEQNKERGRHLFNALVDGKISREKYKYYIENAYQEIKLDN